MVLAAPGKRSTSIPIQIMDKNLKKTKKKKKKKKQRN
jgi:hypothetical protein